MNYIFLTLAIVFETVATISLKSSYGFTKLVPTLTMTVCYACAFYFLSLTMRTLPVGVIYATWSGVGIVLISIFAYLIFGQKTDIMGVLGILFIVLGIFFLNVLSKSNIH